MEEQESQTPVDPGFGAGANPEQDDELEATEVAAEDEAGEESEAESPPAEESEDKPDPFQKRIDELTARFREAERIAAAAQAENERLLRQLDSIPEKTEPAKSLADFDYDEGKYRDYLFEESERRAERAAVRVALEIQRKSSKQSIEEKYAAREREFANSVTDYNDKVYDQSLTISDVMAGEIKQSDIGPELAYYLGSNPDRASVIYRLPERSQVREMALLEVELRAEKAKAKSKKVSGAPPPPAKVKGSEPGIRISTTDPASDKLSDAEWFAAEEKRKAKLRR